MPGKVEQGASEFVTLRKFVQALSLAQSTDQVFAFGLNAIHRIYSPDQAFLSMPEDESTFIEGSLDCPKPQRSCSLIIPVHAGNHLVGKFVLNFKEPRDFSEIELELAETIAAQSGLVIDSLQQKQQIAEMTAMAVHELRSPLTAILGGAMIIRSGGAIDRALEVINRNVRLQEKVIEDLLSISQIDTGKLELEMTALDLRPLLTEVIDEIQLLAAKDGTFIQPDFDGPLNVRGDACRLRQIFSNLLTNAVRSAAPHGQVCVRAAVSDRFVEVNIIDNGVGISQENLPHIFTRFRQAGPAQGRTHNGLGLGLAIVDNLVKLHGGTVVADSAGLGKGAHFCVRLSGA